MAKQTIGIGTVANDNTGDPLRDAMDKVNDNFIELYGFNVLNYGADPTGVANSTTAIQNCINAAKDGTVIIPPGVYTVTSLTVDYATKIVGSGWAAISGGTKLQSTTAFPVFHITNLGGLGYSYGASIQDLCIMGNDAADSGGYEQSGILIDTEGDVLIDHVFIRGCGDYGIRLAKSSHCTKTKIQNCYIIQNVKGGIYGKTLASTNVNAVIIQTTTISQNDGYGINIMGSNIIIRDNLFEDNGSCGIFISGRSVGEFNCNTTNLLIEGNYFEENAGGSVYAEYYYDNSPVVSQGIYNLDIRNNFSYLNTATITKPGVTHQVTVDRASGAYGSVDIEGFHIGQNYYVGTAPSFDGNDAMNYRSVVEIESQDDVANFTGLGTGGDGPTVIIAGVESPSIRYLTITAGGITTAMLHRTIVCDQGGSPVSISAVADGVDGQLVTLIGTHDTNTLTITDGGSVELAGGASAVLGYLDQLTIQYLKVFDKWVEISRANN